jgi:hypothetical protein
MMRASHTRSDLKHGKAQTEHSLAARVGPSLAGLTLIAALMAGGAFLVQLSFSERQVAGAQRVLKSLDGESAELQRHWSLGEVPAKMLQAEQGHIDDEKQQQQLLLNQLKKSAGNG